MVWTVCALAVLLALPALAAHADEEDLNVFEENRQDVAQAMVEQAIQVFEVDGEAAISMMRDPENPLFHDGSVYAFLVDGGGTFLAHAAAPGLIGTSMHGLTDPAGTDTGGTVRVQQLATRRVGSILGRISGFGPRRADQGMACDRMGVHLWCGHLS